MKFRTSTTSMSSQVQAWLYILVVVEAVAMEKNKKNVPLTLLNRKEQHTQVSLVLTPIPHLKVGKLKAGLWKKLSLPNLMHLKKVDQFSIGVLMVKMFLLVLKP